MKAFADGFLPLHLEVNVQRGMLEQVASAVKELKSLFRSGPLEGGLPGLLNRIRSFDGVQDALIEGPHSSLLIPLRMVQNLTGSEVTMSAVLGRGAVTDAITKAFDEWGIKSSFTHIEQADSPLELSLREPSGDSVSIKLYPTSRQRYRHVLGQLDSTPDLLFVNRSNKKLLALAKEVNENGGQVSLRIRKRGRHDSETQMMEMLECATQVCISARDGALREMAKSFDMDVPRGWPKCIDKHWHELARRIATFENGSRLVAFMPEHQPRVYVAVPNAEACVTLEGEYSHASHMARFQGACAAGIAMQIRKGHDILRSSSRTLEAHVRQWLGWSYTGTEVRPWRYPGTEP